MPLTPGSRDRSYRLKHSWLSLMVTPRVRFTMADKSYHRIFQSLMTQLLIQHIQMLIGRLIICCTWFRP
jgi:hypothetical protein